MAAAAPVPSGMAQQTDPVEATLRAPDSFAVLQLPLQKHEAEAVRSQYRRLARLVHPDKNAHPKAEAAFHRLAKAFDDLHDPESQAGILATLRSGAPQQRSPSPPPAAAAAAQRWDYNPKPAAQEEVEIREAAARASHAAKRKRERQQEASEARARQLREELEASLLSDETRLDARSQSWRSFAAAPAAKKVKPRKQPAPPAATSAASSASSAPQSEGAQYACFLCRRGFKTAQLLATHKALSQLHLINEQIVGMRLGANTN
eukprot:TRINITY_DN3517_c0_g1_i1.p1 TRINITY_DN3517_c0_g1~~TRINITY_DN3517_c0_g1_i1.p1  ORF type:complete len:262 (-),score=99.70 TRINITY_DN3517_c0_g1_i1:12-797(-)